MRIRLLENGKVGKVQIILGVGMKSSDTIFVVEFEDNRRLELLEKEFIIIDDL